MNNQLAIPLQEKITIDRAMLNVLLYSKLHCSLLTLPIQVFGVLIHFDFAAWYSYTHITVV